MEHIYIYILSILACSFWLGMGHKTRPSSQDHDHDSRRASSRGLIPRAKVKTVKMTFVIVFGKYTFHYNNCKGTKM